MSKTSSIFNNPQPKKVVKKAYKSKKKFMKSYGDDTNKDYKIAFKEIPTLDFIGASNIVFGEENQKFDKKALIVGNIRMGFGHYRISIAMASAARALGYKPYWLDLASFDATGSKMIRKQNDMYSTASRISQKSKLFNKLVWEPLNSEGFKKISYNAKDQANSELLVPIFRNIPKDIPYIATHVWPSQGAIHAGMTHVVNAIPDNWPMGLHLSEGATHTVQTPFAYLGYKMLNGFAKKPLKPMGSTDLYEVGHYVDHELVSNIEYDVKRRIERIENNKPLRILISVGGAGAGSKQFVYILNHLMNYVKEGRATLLINLGDHKEMLEFLDKHVKGLKDTAKTYFDTYEEVKKFAETLNTKDVEAGVHVFAHKDIFEAVYSTNLLMRGSDFLITKPSELAYYPVVKLMMRHIGGHEVYGAVHAQEYGDSTFECPDEKSMKQMLDTLLNDKDVLIHLNNQIIKLKKDGVYDGGYEVIKLAVKGR